MHQIQHEFSIFFNRFEDAVVWKIKRYCFFRSGRLYASHVPQRYIFVEKRRVLRLEYRVALKKRLSMPFNRLRADSRMLFNICSLIGSLTVYLSWKFWDTLSKKWRSQMFSSILKLCDCMEMSSICQARLTCSCNSALVTDAWSEWTLAVVDIVLFKWPAKIQPSCVFWRVGCLSEDLTWPTHIRFQNKSTPIKRSISDDMSKSWIS